MEGCGGTPTWDGGDDLPLVEPVEDSGLAGIVESQDQNPNLLGTQELPEQLRQEDPHLAAGSGRQSRRGKAGNATERAGVRRG